MSTALSEIVDRVHDRVPRGQARGRYLGLEHVVGGQYRVTGWADAAQYSADALAFSKGDLLYGALRPSMQKLAVAPFDGVASPEFLVLRPRPGIASALVLAWLSHPDSVAFAKMRSRGTRMPRLRWAELAQLHRHLPSPVERAGAVRMLGLINDRLALLHRRDLAHTALLKAAWPSTQKGPRLGDIACIRPTIPAAPAVGLAIGVGDLRANCAAIHQRRYDGHGRRRPVKAGDVLLPRLRPELRKVAICPTDTVASPEILAFTAPDHWKTALLARLLQDSSFRELQRKSTGTRMPRVTTAQVNALNMGISEEQAAEFHQRFGPVVDVLTHSTARAAALRQLRQRVSAGLLQGVPPLAVCQPGRTG